MVKFGVFDHLDDSGVSLSAQYAQRLTIAEACDRAGFYAYHLSEHHGTPHGLAPSPSIFLAALTQRTRRMRLGPLVMLVTLYHPLRVFEEICMLDQMSGGRVEFGIGRGTSAIELGFFGVEAEDAQDRFQESTDIILRAMAGGPLNYRGHYFNLQDVAISLKPWQRPHPPLWYGTNRPETAVWAGRNGVNLASFGKASAVRAVTDSYRAHCPTVFPGPMPLIGMTRHIVVADTDAEAHALASRAYARWFETLTHLERSRGQAGAPKLPASFDEAAATGECVAGSVTTVRDALLRQVHEAGVNYLLCQVAFGDLPLAASLNSVSALETEIMPAFGPAQAPSKSHRSDRAAVSTH
jgi:alkanesulfonate monooxygenase SsuD/methylene tetrahydromethanopterin reductase-like flavin-dependent oxidoreductase (luciferase family)